MPKIRIRFQNIPKKLVLLILALLSLLLFVKTTNENKKGFEVRQNSHKKKDIHEAHQMSKDTKEMVPILLKHMHWTSNENVLDYGCGDGAVGYHLIFPKVKELHGHQYALDSVYNNLERARRLYQNQHISYASGNLLGNTTDQFPFLDMRFDKIFAIYVFHFVHNLLKLVGRLWYLLTPGGQIGFTSLTEQAIAFQIPMRLSKHPIWRNYLNNYEKTYHPSWSRIFEKQTGPQRRKSVHTMFKTVGFKTNFLGFGNVTSFHKDVDSLIDPWFWESQIYDNVPENLIPSLKLEIKRQFSKITLLSASATNFTLTQTYLMAVLEKE